MQLREALQSQGNTKFESREAKELEKLRRRKVHDLAVLRVQCPDKVVLQLRFAPSTLISEVLAVVAPHIAPHLQSWYLYQTPPMRKLEGKRTLAQEDLVPGALVHLGVERDERGQAVPGPYLSVALMATLPPAPPTPAVVSAYQQPIANRADVLAAAEARAAAGGPSAAPFPKMPPPEKMPPAD